MTDPAHAGARKWMVEVTTTDGTLMHLRRGAKPGAGPIVQFRSKKTAEINAEMLSNGLDDGEIAAVVRYDKHYE